MKWKIIRNGFGRASRIEDENDKDICYGEIEEEDACLIASAPELLEALQECMDELFLIHSKYGDHQNAIDHCSALGKGQNAIKKATSEKQPPVPTGNEE